MIVRALGVTAYEATWRAMQRFTDARGEHTEDELWLTEHPAIYTLGLAGRREHVLRDNGIPLVQVDRGGQVTYHGPGQLVVYTLVDLRRARLGIRDMVRRLEGAVIEWLSTHRIDACGKVDAPGVYVGSAKIAALGLRVRRQSTYHGLAVNVAMNLAPFDDIDPCGYPGLAVTQLADLGVSRTVAQAGDELTPFLRTKLS
jgi:lipoyl(octanoyl) transferase